MTDINHDEAQKNAKDEYLNNYSSSDIERQSGLSSRGLVWHGVWYRLALLTSLFLALNLLISLVISPVGVVLQIAENGFNNIDIPPIMYAYIPLIVAWIGEGVISSGLIHRDLDRVSLTSKAVVFKNIIVALWAGGLGFYAYYTYPTIDWSGFDNFAEMHRWLSHYVLGANILFLLAVIWGALKS